MMHCDKDIDSNNTVEKQPIRRLSAKESNNSCNTCVFENENVSKENLMMLAIN